MFDPSVVVNLLGALTCMFMLLGDHRGLRGTVLLADVVQCRTVRVDVLRVKKGARGSRLCFGRIKSGVRAVLIVPLEQRVFFTSDVGLPPSAADQWERE